MHSNFLFSRFIGDAFVDVDEPNWFTDLLDAEVVQGALQRQFELNTVDVVVSWTEGTVSIRDVLDGDDELQIELGEALAVLANLGSFSSRIRKRLDSEFRQHREEAYATLGQIHDDDIERLAGAALICARGDIDQLKVAVQQSHLDWRDLVVSAGLEHSTWRDDLDQAWPQDPNPGPAGIRSILGRIFGRSRYGAAHFGPDAAPSGRDAQ